MTPSDISRSHTLAIGLLTAPEAKITFHRGYSAEGTYTFSVADAGRTFEALAEQSSFTLHNFIIGVGFHWQQVIPMTFSGNIRLLADGDNLVVVNDVDVEEYLKSVISSEMSATAHSELLKAHAVISRSWVMAQIAAKKLSDKHTPDDRRNEPETLDNGDGEIIRWYDHDDHALFDVCADDHCQRYQGISRITTDAAHEAVEATRGMVLTDEDGNLCDARFSKCCGGAMERFSACWEDKDYHYLLPLRDAADDIRPFPSLSREAEARKWILSRPEAWCNCTSEEILHQVLVDFDHSTRDFYRWQVNYTVDELSDLVARRSGIDFGKIIDLVPVERGDSGRIIRLRICGTKRTVTVGKELEIRRWLSESHLYSSAFVVDKIFDTDANADEEIILCADGSEKEKKSEPTLIGFRLSGAGWGHGVGLCQIGAAVMAQNGYTYRQILSHYYPGSHLRSY